MYEWQIDKCKVVFTSFHLFAIFRHSFDYFFLANFQGWIYAAYTRHERHVPQLEAVVGDIVLSDKEASPRCIFLRFNNRVMVINGIFCRLIKRTMSSPYVCELTETGSAHAQKVIDDVCKQSGDTFSHDPYCRSMFTEPFNVKVWPELSCNRHDKNSIKSL